MLIPFTDCIKAANGKTFAGVLHIGAHLGEEGPDYVANGVRYVIWVEGNRTLMKNLFDNTRTLQLKQTYLNELLSDKDNEKVQFNITNNGQSSSILPLGTHLQHYPQIGVVETRELQTTRFDTLYQKNITHLRLEDIDFINLDVQGAELKVLEGFGSLLSRYDNIKAIYSEVNFEEVYVGAPLVGKLDDYLSQFGFVRVLTRETQYGWGDALFLRK